MSYTEFKPSFIISEYIDAYWEVNSNSLEVIEIEKVLPDGCIDIIFNLGEDFNTGVNTSILKNEKAYIGGAITNVKIAKIQPNTHLVGLRFKPGAFSRFYKCPPLQELKNNFMEVDRNQIPEINAIVKNMTAAFDKFFCNKLVDPKVKLQPFINHIDANKGNLSVASLAKNKFTTPKTLERNFNRYIGLTPIEYINIVRYKFATKLIKKHYPKKSLLGIALECGYYDHAHLCNELKKYTGLAPSSFLK